MNKLIKFINEKGMRMSGCIIQTGYTFLSRNNSSLSLKTRIGKYKVGPVLEKKGPTEVERTLFIGVVYNDDLSEENINCFVVREVIDTGMGGTMTNVFVIPPSKEILDLLPDDFWEKIYDTEVF